MPGETYLSHQEIEAIASALLGIDDEYGLSIGMPQKPYNVLAQADFASEEEAKEYRAQVDAAYEAGQELIRKVEALVMQGKGVTLS